MKDLCRVGHLKYLLIGLVLSSLGLAVERLDIEFLEYLASYEEMNGEWVDPVTFAAELEEMTENEALVHQGGDETNSEEEN